MRSRRAALLLAPALLLPLPGCCTLARLFCGPDKSPWVSESLATPEATVATLLEAVRRDAPAIVYRCLAADFRVRNNLDSVTAQIFWDRLRQQVPGLHLLGYATVPPPTTLADNGATFVVEAQGHRLRIDLVRESFREVVYRRPDGSRGEAMVPEPSWNTRARVTRIDDPDFDRSRLLLEPLEFEHEGLPEVPLEDIERAGLVRLWRVTELRQIDG